MMEEKFEIEISSRQNSTWQGTLRTAGEAVPFRSELELLLELARRLSAETPRWTPLEAGRR